MNTNITELKNEELETIQGGRGSTHVGNTAPIDPLIGQWQLGVQPVAYAPIYP
jgi:hypothetical protein